MRSVTGSDMVTLGEWYAAHGAAQPDACVTPPTGLIEPGVAAGFLIRTDSGVAFLEGYVTNPAASLRSRSRAISRITFALRQEAKLWGAVRVLALTRAGGISRRANKLGLQSVGSYQLLAGEP